VFPGNRFGGGIAVIEILDAATNVTRTSFAARPPR
jgi:hypothetical protein